MQLVTSSQTCAVHLACEMWPTMTILACERVPWQPLSYNVLAAAWLDRLACMMEPRQSSCYVWGLNAF